MMLKTAGLLENFVLLKGKDRKFLRSYSEASSLKFNLQYNSSQIPQNAVLFKTIKSWQSYNMIAVHKRF